MKLKCSKKQLVIIIAVVAVVVVITLVKLAGPQVSYETEAVGYGPVVEEVSTIDTVM